MTLQQELEQIGRQARAASNILRSLSRSVKDDALRGAAQAVRASRDIIKQENVRDLEAGRAKGLSSAMLDRLELTDKRIDAMAEGLEVVASLRDPVGDVTDQYIHPNGLRISRVRQPLGVVSIIYESRPNVTADAAALCLKAGNATVLRGGSEAIHSNVAIARVFSEATSAAGVPEHAVQILTTTDRAAVGEMLKLDKYIDVIVPRGGKSLIARIYEESRIPVVAHLDGICHTYQSRTFFCGIIGKCIERVVFCRFPIVYVSLLQHQTRHAGRRREREFAIAGNCRAGIRKRKRI